MLLLLLPLQAALAAQPDAVGLGGPGLDGVHKLFGELLVRGRRHEIQYRLAYVNRQTQMGRNVFLVDVDTMWNRKVDLSDLFDGTPDDSSADVFFSQGTVYPHDAFDAWGFVGCMGSVAFRATPRTTALLKAAMEDCKAGACDDQVAMNGALLRKYGVDWNRVTGFGHGTMAAPVANRLKVTDANAMNIKVRVWPKPFAFRSFMKDVRRVETASLAGSAGGASGVCLGQVEPAALGEAPITTGPKGAVVDYARPFIVAPLRKAPMLTIETRFSSADGSITDCGRSFSASFLFLYMKNARRASRKKRKKSPTARPALLSLFWPETAAGSYTATVSGSSALTTPP